MDEQLLDEVRAGLRLPDPAARRALRRQAQLSQERMARELDVSRQSIARYEAGLRRPQGTRLLAYVALLETLRKEVQS
ncbi:MAG: helix-turn-helix domain-containing protein [Thermoleophilia bacterium]